MEKQKYTKYFKDILDSISSISTCNRAKISAIITRNNFIISTGFNGSPRKIIHCNDSNHLLLDNHCQRTVHGEVNAILNAAKNGININGCIMYSSHKPCYNCMKILINSGIICCFYFNDYKDNFQEYFERNKYCKFIKVK